jgi:predicted site-specific integrase-resolvase
MAILFETLGAENRKPKSDNDLDAFSIQEFCRRHSISRSTYYNLRNAGKGPAESRVMGRVIITKESAQEWRRKITQQAA